MKELFCSYEQSLALKELGFDEPCFDNYNWRGVLWGMSLDKQTTVNGACLAPLKSQVFKWFREKYNADVVIQPQVVGYYAKILINNKNVFDTIQNYEEAEDACIDKLIESLKQPK